MAAPANPPIKVCEDDEGIPKRQVSRFQAIAARTPERMMGRVMNSSITTFETVLAIPNSPMIYFAIKNAIKFPECCPDYCLERGEHTGGHNSSDGVSCIMKTVDKVENDSQGNHNNQ